MPRRQDAKMPRSRSTTTRKTTIQRKRRLEKHMYCCSVAQRQELARRETGRMVGAKRLSRGTRRGVTTRRWLIPPPKHLWAGILSGGGRRGGGKNRQKMRCLASIAKGMRRKNSVHHIQVDRRLIWPCCGACAFDVFTPRLNLLLFDRNGKRETVKTLC